MLIRFQVKNHLSFNEKVEISMVKGKVRKHPNHVIETNYKGVKLLKSGIIYGANASGKSNLIKAMQFATQQIIESHSIGHNQPITTIPFKLDKQCLTQPSFFEFTMLVNDVIYVYGFELTKTEVVNEWLYQRQKNGKHLQLFERTNDETTGTALVEFGDYKSTSHESLKKLNYCAETTGKNKLFLSNTVDDRFTDFRHVFDWFEDRIKFVFPSTNSAQLPMFSTNEELLGMFMTILNEFDTGVANLCVVPINIERVRVPQQFLDTIENDLENDQGTLVHSDNDWYILKKENGHLKFQQLMTEHESADGSLVKFELNEESDGTFRILNLIPVLLQLIHSESTFVIDEIGRSLHPNLSEKIIEIFLSQSTKSQLILTTHESKLLDLDLLRRDEIWFVEKASTGASSVYSLEEFEPRYDKDIRTAYLSGRFGGVANLAPNSR
ncbi:MAG: AAA family ATPase [Candidatus Promineifilaceae bacterium]